MKYLLIVLLWIGFGVIHSLMIDEKFSKQVAKVMGRYFVFYRLTYNMLSMVLLWLLLDFTRDVDHTFIIHFSSPWSIIQYLLMTVSVATILWALFSYDVFEFVGIRPILDSVRGKLTVVEKLQPLTKQGLLGVVRHPMYLATIVLMWSLNSTLADVMVHVVMTVYIIVGIRLEEKKLISKYGQDYIDYQREVPALIPFSKNLVN